MVRIVLLVQQPGSYVTHLVRQRRPEPLSAVDHLRAQLEACRDTSGEGDGGTGVGRKPVRGREGKTEVHTCRSYHQQVTLSHRCPLIITHWSGSLFSRLRLPSSSTCPAVDSRRGFHTSGRSSGRRPPNTAWFHLKEQSVDKKC